MMNEQLDNLAMLYDGWQSQLLAEMGVTRWVSQDCPVIEIAVTDITQALLTHPLDSETLIQDDKDNQNKLSQNSADGFDKLSTQTANTAETMPTVSEPAVAEQVEVTQTQIFMESAVVVDSQSVVAVDSVTLTQLTISKSIATRFELQAVVVADWVLLVDSQYLQTNIRQMMLWQQIVNHLKVTTHFFKFPLLEKSEKLPTSTIEMMSTAQLASAGFSGFLCSLVGTSTMKLGALTNLPECLEDEPIQRLPYLEEMLEDYRHKRQFWLLLTS